MSDERTPQQTLEEHIAARNGVISEYGQLWRQAIHKSGIIDAEKETMEAVRGCVALGVLSQGYESADSINRIIDDAYVEMRKRQLQ